MYASLTEWPMISQEAVHKELRRRELWSTYLERLKGNPYHRPPGPGGGQFTSGPESSVPGQEGNPPIKVTSIKEALRLLKDGKGIEFERPEQVVTLLHKIRKIVKKAMEAGEHPPVFNLCGVYVKGTNVFCRENVNIPRSEMPQLTGIPKKGSLADKLPRKASGKVDINTQFYQHLVASGVKVEKVDVKANRIRAAQREIDGAKVQKVLHDYEKHGIDPDRYFFISDDHYIVDGHHHWAAQIALDKVSDDRVKTHVYRVNEKILPLLDRANKFADHMGLERRSIGEKGWGHCETCGEDFDVQTEKAVSTTTPALVRLASRLEPSLRRKFLAAVEEAQSDIVLEELAAAIESNSLTAVQVAAKLADLVTRFADLGPDLRAGFFVGSTHAFRTLAEEGGIQMAFATVNPEAVAYAGRHLADLVQPFQDDARTLIAEQVQRVLSHEETASGAARKIRDWIGLDPRRATALQHYEDALRADGIAEDTIARKLAREERRLLTQRAEVIARNEVMKATNAGQRAAELEAAKQGLLKPFEWERQWVITDDERVCPICEPLDGEVVGFSQSFPQGEPPLHVLCRCTIRTQPSGTALEED